jgi:hypothetical protein
MRDSDDLTEATATAKQLALRVRVIRSEANCQNPTFISKSAPNTTGFEIRFIPERDTDSDGCRESSTLSELPDIEGGDAEQSGVRIATLGLAGEPGKRTEEWHSGGAAKRTRFWPNQ